MNFEVGDKVKLINDIEKIKGGLIFVDGMLEIKNKYGKNAILKGMDLEDGATTRDRNRQIGGHHE